MTAIRSHSAAIPAHDAADPALLVEEYAGSHFGEHVTIDGYQCSQEKLGDQKAVARCLQELPALLLMKPLSEPVVYYAKGTGPKDPGGWTGFVVVEESHISVHTFPDLRFVSIDVYTCKNGLLLPKIEDYFREALGVGIFESNFIKRGLQFSALALGQNRLQTVVPGGR